MNDSSLQSTLSRLIRAALPGYFFCFSLSQTLCLLSLLLSCVFGCQMQIQAKGLAYFWLIPMSVQVALMLWSH